MSYSISDSFKLIFNQLKSNTQIACFSQQFEFIELLETLNATERYLLAASFCKLPWDVGSVHVLAALQKVRILTATEFISRRMYTNQNIHLILNDFLEQEYELITNLIINASFQSYPDIKELLEECLEYLFKDLLSQPEFNNLNYLSCLKTQLPVEILLGAIQTHIAVILKLHQADVRTSFSKFSAWINEGVNDLKFPKDLYEKVFFSFFIKKKRMKNKKMYFQLIFDYLEESLNYLLKLSNEENFKGWKFFLIILQTLSSSNNKITGPFMQKYLKSRIKQSASINNKGAVMHLLLTARAFTATDMNINKNLNSYADWYKANIGEMKYYLKTEEFQTILHLLQECIDYEMEEDYLEIHSTIVISPPVLCSKLVHAYKNKCKQRLKQIKDGLQNVDINESIVIEISN
ncbi:uncharacterized protein ACN427_001675 isoform 1-T1 [Glossina fuscipes fuscipes]